jgi:hypothetical protein
MQQEQKEKEYAQRRKLYMQSLKKIRKLHGRSSSMQIESPTNKHKSFNVSTQKIKRKSSRSKSRAQIERRPSIELIADMFQNENREIESKEAKKSKRERRRRRKLKNNLISKSMDVKGRPE